MVIYRLGLELLETSFHHLLKLDFINWNKSYLQLILIASFVFRKFIISPNVKCLTSPAWSTFFGDFALFSYWFFYRYLIQWIFIPEVLEEGPHGSIFIVFLILFPLDLVVIESKLIILLFLRFIEACFISIRLLLFLN